MFEFLAFVVAVIVQSVPVGDSGAGTQVAGDQDTMVTAQAEAEVAATPMFLAPAQSGDQSQAEQPATPSFLGSAPAAPAGEPAPATAFLGSAASGTASGAASGAAPAALQAEPQVPSGRFTTAVEVKPILSMTKANWISVREFNGEDLLYVTHLWSWRCGLLEVKVGVNGDSPQPWPLPPCHLNDPTPNAIKESDGLPYRNFGLGQVALVEVHVTYDDLSTENVKFNRQGLPLQ
ncbi:hypothetical protein QEZ52_13615 [Aliisedimentitalea scapharcae]|uniref:Uncharacterized protein n=1 Tax=Aliisedimentitalea scapharcae TaxID=1524259 RepID=A0ABZ2XPL2_9RHOB